MTTFNTLGIVGFVSVSIWILLSLAIRKTRDRLIASNERHTAVHVKHRDEIRALERKVSALTDHLRSVGAVVIDNDGRPLKNMYGALCVESVTVGEVLRLLMDDMGVDIGRININGKDETFLIEWEGEDDV